MNERESSGYNAIMGEIRVEDFYDPHNVSMTWLFAIADYMWAINGELMPGYFPSPFGVDLEDPDHALGMLFEINDQFDDDDLRRVYKVMDRYNDWVRLAGRAY